MNTISACDVVRWFCVDWEFFGDTGTAVEKHDEILDVLGSMKDTCEVNSGHTGVNVAFENSKRTDAQIVEEIKRLLTPIQKDCNKRRRL